MRGELIAKLEGSSSYSYSRLDETLDSLKLTKILRSGRLAADHNNIDRV